MLRLRIGLGVALALACLGVVATANPSSASAPKPPKFSGIAPGSVTCALSLKITFSSPITLSGGGTSSTVKGKLKECTSSASPVVTVKKGTLTGTLTGNPIDCVGPSTGAAQGTLSITWKGAVNGAVRTITYKGNATFAPSPTSSTGDELVTNGSGEEGLQVLATNTGSFPGGVSFSAFTDDNASQITTMCETRATSPAGRGQGIKKLTLTGTITAGGVGQATSDGTGFCVTLTSGTVECWGSGTDGAIGNDSTSDSRVPAIIGVTTATGVASDGTHSYCASLVSGDVDCWGLDTDGELGDGTTGTDTDVPTGVEGVSTAVSVVSAGDHSYCAVLANGTLDCWGLGTSGQLGNDSSSSSDTAVAVSGLNGVTSVTSEGDSYCAVEALGAVACWGDGGNGDLGNNSTSDSPVPVATGIGSALSVVSDGNHSYCALVSSGAVDCWGLGTDGQLGNGLGTTSHVPVGVSNITTARSLASNGNNSYCAVLANGTIDCWGFNSIGQLGNDATTSSNSPVQVSVVDDAATTVGDGVNSYCAVLASESVVCWGAGGSGQLGDGGVTDSDVPVSAGPMGPAVSLVGEGSGTFCAVLASKAMGCWGSNGGGALGDGSGGASSSSPVTVSDLTL